MGEVKVIGATTSLFCTRVEWAIKLKGVEYEYIQEDVRNKSPLLLKHNPVHKKVPVILHGGRAVAESLVILEYIDDTWKQNPLLPEDPYERSTARFWAKFSDDKCIFGAFDACKAEGEEKEKAIESARESLSFLEEQIEGKTFFGGEKIGFLDLAVGWIPLWLGVMEQVGEMKLLDAEKFPSLHEWSQNFIKIPLIKEALPPREKLVDYFTASVNYMRSLASQKQ
ncbi:probable glutathione S-transferase [Rhododendron vialii]|uniref:probable glutathione S-transferase n=1 Tax=Rhododendron vialii TaxID=182163 RepID=UPI00265EDEF0|nr:probable glutathione S-transferase [Rhododendron vialii]